MKKLSALLKKWFSSSKGFTLIELLVVIAILGVLLVGSIVAINPAQKINQAKDATAKGSVDQVATALQAWSTQNAGAYPTAVQFSANPSILVSSGELKALPTAPNNAALTYASNGTDASVSFTLQDSNKTDALNGCTAAAPCTVWCWRSSVGKAINATSCPNP